MRFFCRGLTKASLFKFLWIGNLTGFFFFFLLCGIASLTGAETVTLNGRPVTGPQGFLVAMVLWPIFAAIFTCLQWVFFAFGFWIYGRFWRITLDVRDGELADVGAAREPSSPPAP
jgi:hypothetical protein